jgi:hypothetical protein
MALKEQGNWSHVNPDLSVIPFQGSGRDAPPTDHDPVHRIRELFFPYEGAKIYAMTSLLLPAVDLGLDKTSQRHTAEKYTYRLKSGKTVELITTPDGGIAFLAENQATGTGATKDTTFYLGDRETIGKVQQRMQSNGTPISYDRVSVVKLERNRVRLTLFENFEGLAPLGKVIHGPHQHAVDGRVVKQSIVYALPPSDNLQLAKLEILGAGLRGLADNIIIPDSLLSVDIRDLREDKNMQSLCKML